MEPLDNWVWRALTGPQRHLAEGAPPALRYEPSVSVFSGLPDDVTDEAFDALAALVGPGGTTLVFRGDLRPVPPGWTDLGRFPGVQMVGPAPPGDGPAALGVDPEIDATIEVLTADDVPAMLDLVALTEPGPFAPRTIEMGTYLGIREDGELIAMAGQRMRIEGYTEVSAVCTRPDHRGRGLAGALVSRLVGEIHSRGDVPFLAAVSTNAVAISRYASLGFEIRREVTAALLVAPG